MNQCYKIINLHSIMYLLIRDVSNGIVNSNVFTFHNVSINSKYNLSNIMKRAYLHSIMYLLILVSRFHRIEWRMVFTFHNVSINSLFRRKHSGAVGLFTFHNVSINSQDS